MDDQDEEPVVIYHSHTATEAYPSRTDIAYASEPNAHYVLVSTRFEDETEFRSFTIVDGVVTEEPVTVVESDA
jgi:proteasome lid subunit RPN8/RPN11